MSRNAKPVKNSVLLGDKKEAANGAVEAVAESGAATTTVDVDSEQKTQESSAEEMTPDGSAEETISDGSADEATPDVSADGTIPQVAEPPIEKTTKPTDEPALDTGVEPDAEDNLQTINPSAETGDEATAETDGQSEPAPTDTTTELDEAEDLDLSDRPQLRPPRTLETTLFDRLERLYGDGIKRVLKVQYR
jgi:DNA polymerase alpha-associated DNA helicase A